MVSLLNHASFHGFISYVYRTMLVFMVSLLNHASFHGFITYVYRTMLVFMVSLLMPKFKNLDFIKDIFMGFKRHMHGF
jgi:flagellar biosynthesis protein FlhB